MRLGIRRIKLNLRIERPRLSPAALHRRIAEDRIARFVRPRLREMFHAASEEVHHIARDIDRAGAAIAALPGAVHYARPARLGGGHDGLVLACLALVVITRVAGPLDPLEAASGATAARTTPTHQPRPIDVAALSRVNTDNDLLDPTRLAYASPPQSPPAARLLVPPQTVYVDEGARLSAELSAARLRCLARLRESAEYRAALDEANRLEARVRELRRRDPRHDLPRASADWMDAKSALGRMSAAALAVDPEVRKLERLLREHETGR